MTDDLDQMRWPTGFVILAGLVIGAFAGLLVDQVPVGTVAGLALGCGIDSLLNHLWNGRDSRL